MCCQTLHWSGHTSATHQCIATACDGGLYCSKLYTRERERESMKWPETEILVLTVSWCKRCCPLWSRPEEVLDEWWIVSRAWYTVLTCIIPAYSSGASVCSLYSEWYSVGIIFYSSLLTSSVRDHNGQERLHHETVSTSISLWLTSCSLSLSISCKHTRHTITEASILASRRKSSNTFCCIVPLAARMKKHEVKYTLVDGWWNRLAQSLWINNYEYSDARAG